MVGQDGKVKHVGYVKEIGSEPNYDAALARGEVGPRAEAQVPGGRSNTTVTAHSA